MDGRAERGGPGAAERARTVLACAPALDVVVDGPGTDVVAVHAVQLDGTLVLLVPADGSLVCRVAAGPVPCTVHAARVTSVPSPDRVVDRVAVRGLVRLEDDVPAGIDALLTAHPGDPDVVLRPDASALLRVDVRAVAVDGVPISAGEYAAAACDPIVPTGDRLAAHLAAAYPTEVRDLASLLDDATVRAARSVAPIAIDRFGVTLQVLSGDGFRRARLDFPVAVRSADQLWVAIHALHLRATRLNRS
jgi:hypothetical protein